MSAAPWGYAPHWGPLERQTSRQRLTPDWKQPFATDLLVIGMEAWPLPGLRRMAGYEWVKDPRLTPKRKQP